MSKVRVTADAAGRVVVPSKNNPEWGYIRVEQDRVVVDENGFARAKEMSALIMGKIEDLKKFGYQAGQEIDGRVIFKEKLTPFNKENPDKDLKIAGETGIICSVNGESIYRKNFYNQDSDAQDVCVEHTNGEEIKEAYTKLALEKGGEDLDKI
jgi:hypothetical protein